MAETAVAKERGLGRRIVQAGTKLVVGVTIAYLGSKEGALPPWQVGLTTSAEAKEIETSAPADIIRRPFDGEFVLNHHELGCLEVRMPDCGLSRRSPLSPGQLKWPTYIRQPARAPDFETEGLYRRDLFPGIPPRSARFFGQGTGFCQEHPGKARYEAYLTTGRGRSGYKQVLMRGWCLSLEEAQAAGLR